MGFNLRVLLVRGLPLQPQRILIGARPYVTNNAPQQRCLALKISDVFLLRFRLFRNRI